MYRMGGRNKASLEAFGSLLEANGVEVFHGSQSLASQRQVADLLWFIDPAGFRVELVWKPKKHWNSLYQVVPSRDSRLDRLGWVMQSSTSRISIKWLFFTATFWVPAE